MNKFINGLVFGSGFGLALILILYLFTSLNVERKTYNIDQSLNSNIDQTSFRDLSVDDQIKQSSVIVIAIFQKADNGKNKSIITEILKQDTNTEFYYSIGDEYSPPFPHDNFYGDGEVIFFTGSPAEVKRAVSFYGNRIHGLGNIPIELFRSKCRTNDV